MGVCEKGCCLAVTSLLTLGYSIFELTCLPSALKSVDFTGFLLVFLCQRSLWVVLFFGAGDEARTRYLDLGKVALYQMSYARKMVPQAGVEPATRGFSVRCSTN